MRGTEDDGGAARSTVETGAGSGPDATATVPATSPWRLEHTPALDGVRAVAVMLVIGVHAWFSGMPGGGIGVTIFFTLSGFLITALLLAETSDHGGRLSFKNFYMRRVLRLFPALVVFVAVVWAYSQIADFEAERTTSAVPPALLYYANWARAFGAKLGMLGHTWSLAVEEQFYLIWPLVLWLAYRFARVWGVLAAALLGTLASTAARMYLQSSADPAMGPRIQNGFDTQSASIFVGCALAAMLFLGWRPRRWMVAPAALLTVWYVYLLTTQIFKAGEASRGVMPLVVAMGFASVICWFALWPRSIPAKVLGFAPIAYIGRISYGLYLWHFPVTAVVGRYGYKDSPTTLLLVTAISVPIATASFFGVERPFLRLKDRFRTAPAEPAEPAAARAAQELPAPRVDV